MAVSPPRDEADLLGRARDLAGCRLGELAARLQVSIPADPRRSKGWAGTLLETALGATAASKPEPDFQALGIEMKTIPIGRDGRPRESTYVCTVPLVNDRACTWQHAPLRRKLERVLWVPLEAAPGIGLPERRVGTALLWRPDAEEEAGLRADWEELMDMVCLGELSKITAHHGTWLQIRPKAADSRARRLGVEASGELVPTLPRGFYLRPVFTERLLRRHYAIAECYS